MGNYKYSNLKQETKTSGTVSLQKIKKTKTIKPGTRESKMPAWFKNWSDNQFQPLVDDVNLLKTDVNLLKTTANKQDKKINSVNKNVSALNTKLTRVIKLNNLKS